jgi:hypothetical protein
VRIPISSLRAGTMATVSKMAARRCAGTTL